MTEDYAILVGELAGMPGKDALNFALESAGFSANVGEYTIRLIGFDHFVFRNLGGDLGEPMVSAEHESAKSLSAMAQKVSAALAVARIVHRFEIYDAEDNLFAKYEDGWPLPA